jgi:NTP pyrophosphatase (non-canonical NTP hydrolase)
MVLAMLAGDIEEVNRANGWYDESRTFGEDIALLHSEVSEAFEGWRNNDMENVAEELADILIRLLDTASRHNVDLYAETKRKIEKNRERGYKHGGKRI